ncbi:MAG: immunoglobulin-like domain-containing protein [Acetobacterium sp.]
MSIMKKLQALLLLLILMFANFFPFGKVFAQDDPLNQETANAMGITYQSHVASVGWQEPWINNGEASGTTGQSLSLEALKIRLMNAPAAASIVYAAYLPNIGWQDQVTGDQLAGTTGQDLEMEAIKISLINMPGYKVEYQAHIENIGWCPWVSQGEIAGTIGKSLRMEGIRIRIVSSRDSAALNAAIKSAGVLNPSEYFNYDTVLPSLTAALALPAITTADVLAKIGAINVAIAALEIVPDTTAPVIQLIGSEPASANQIMVATETADSYADPGVVATDNLAGNITAKVVVTGTVDTRTVGSTPLTYTVTDAAGNSATIERTVNVVARLDPATITKYASSLVIPWAMPTSVDPNDPANTSYYEIAMRQFDQQMLPAGLPMTTVWGYGSTNPGAVFNSPSLTIETKANVPTRIKWINDLVDANGNYLPPLLPIDQTIDGFPDFTGALGTNSSQTAYTGPVPITTLVNGAHAASDRSGFPESWYLPTANNIPANVATAGPDYAINQTTAQSGTSWTPGNAVFDYTNDQKANTIWYHDNALGFTITNAYAGPTGFYLIRDNPGDTLTDSATVAGGTAAVLPGPTAVTLQQYVDSIDTGSVYEIPMVLQDRTFNTDGSLFYPGKTTEFDSYTDSSRSDTEITPVLNPEFLGDTIIANGNTWPTLKVQQKKYRFRFLNGSQARTFILGLQDTTKPVINPSFWQIGSNDGFLAAPTCLTTLLMMPGQRADVIIDFSKSTINDNIILTNIGPDSPYHGGVPGLDFPVANPTTTGQVMQFKVIASDVNPDLSTDPSLLILPGIATPLSTPTTPGSDIVPN